MCAAIFYLYLLVPIFWRQLGMKMGAHLTTHFTLRFLCLWVIPPSIHPHCRRWMRHPGLCRKPYSAGKLRGPRCNYLFLLRIYKYYTVLYNSSSVEKHRHILRLGALGWSSVLQVPLAECLEGSRFLAVQPSNGKHSLQREQAPLSDWPGPSTCCPSCSGV